MNRIEKHPILSIPDRLPVTFFWQGNCLAAYQGETISSALFANDIHIFGHHPRDGSTQSLFCANGQCAQCMVLVDGYPVKGCMELIKQDMHVEPVDNLPVLPDVNHFNSSFADPVEIAVPVLIIGGGPAGLSAAIELSKAGIRSLLVDDKHRLGGKLVLQTHRFFGSADAVFAGTRGIDIASRLESELREFSECEIWLHSPVLGVFSDQKTGILRDGKRYTLVSAEYILVASGARELFLAFPGNTLPGIFGAGAFQTLVNRDLIRPAEKLFIIGGGNVGLIAGYHSLQAGIEVVGLAEAMPVCGGYKVHKDKLARMGVPIYTSHTISSANGVDKVESVTIVRVDKAFQPIAGTEQTFACDSVLVAVGLEPVDEFYRKAVDFGMKAFAAGDTEEISEASAAILSGRIKGREIANAIGSAPTPIPTEWYHIGEVLKSHPGKVVQSPELPIGQRVMPVIHCTQEIPCNPCSTICPRGLIRINSDDIRQVPVFQSEAGLCTGCELCLTYCPGLAITVVDFRRDSNNPTVSIPFEFNLDLVDDRQLVEVTDTEGQSLGEYKVQKIKKMANRDHTLIVQLRAPQDIATRIAGIRVQEENLDQPMSHYIKNIHDETIICRCERVTAGEIRELIKQGYHDINEIKAITHAAMGACGAKTCRPLIRRLFRDEGIELTDVVDSTRRPIFVEAALSVFAGMAKGEEGRHE